jgi:hypothetical protein
MVVVIGGVIILFAGALDGLFPSARRERPAGPRHPEPTTSDGMW